MCLYWNGDVGDLLQLFDEYWLVHGISALRTEKLLVCYLVVGEDYNSPAGCMHCVHTTWRTSRQISLATCNGDGSAVVLLLDNFCLCRSIAHLLIVGLCCFRTVHRHSLTLFCIVLHTYDIGQIHIFGCNEEYRLSCHTKQWHQSCHYGQFLMNLCPFLCNISFGKCFLFVSAVPTHLIWKCSIKYSASDTKVYKYICVQADVLISIVLAKSHNQWSSYSKFMYKCWVVLGFASINFCIHNIPCLSLTQNERFYAPLDGFVSYVLPETQMILYGNHALVQWQFTFWNVVVSETGLDCEST